MPSGSWPREWVLISLKVTHAHALEYHVSHQSRSQGFIFILMSVIGRSEISEDVNVLKLESHDRPQFHSSCSDLKVPNKEYVCKVKLKYQARKRWCRLCRSLIFKQTSLHNPSPALSYVSFMVKTRWKGYLLTVRDTSVERSTFFISIIYSSDFSSGILASVPVFRIKLKQAKNISKKSLQLWTHYLTEQLRK